MLSQDKARRTIQSSGGSLDLVLAQRRKPKELYKVKTPI